MSDPSIPIAPGPAQSPGPALPLMAVQPNGPDISTLLNGWQMPPPGPQSQTPGHVPDVDKLLDGWKLPEPPKPSDMELKGPPLMARDSHLMDMPDRFQSFGKISIDGDILAQQLGRGHKIEYSLSQLSAHAKDPEYFAGTLRYAANQGDSVKIDFHHGVMSVSDPALERTLPRDMPLRDPILRAAVIHNIDPQLLAAVGVQETHLGADYLGVTPAHYNSTHRGDVESDSPGGHGYGPFQLDDRYHSLADCQKAARDPYFAADKAASMMADNLAATKGNVSEALHLYNAGTLTRPSTTTDWGPLLGALPYEDSASRYLQQVQSRTVSSWEHEKGVDRGLGR